MTIATGLLPENIQLALGYSRNFATAKPNIGLTEKEHILGLSNLLEKTALELQTAISQRSAPVAAPADYALRARVADLLHLLQFAKIETPRDGDAAQAEIAMNDLERMLAAAPAAPADVDDECVHEFVPFQAGCTKCGEPYATHAAPAAPAPEAQEPVAWMCDDGMGYVSATTSTAVRDDWVRQEIIVFPLFRAAPPAAEQPASSRVLTTALKPFADAFEATGLPQYRGSDDEHAEFLDENQITPVRGIAMRQFRRAWEVLSGKSALLGKEGD